MNEDISLQAFLLPFYIRLDALENKRADKLTRNKSTHAFSELNKIYRLLPPSESYFTLKAALQALSSVGSQGIQDYTANLEQYEITELYENEWFADGDLDLIEKINQDIQNEISHYSQIINSCLQFFKPTIGSISKMVELDLDDPQNKLLSSVKQKTTDSNKLSVNQIVILLNLLRTNSLIPNFNNLALSKIAAVLFGKSNESIRQHLSTFNSTKKSKEDISVLKNVLVSMFD